MKTITYDETKFQLLPVSLDGNMITAAANTELLANRNHGEPASIADLWNALRAAAPQPECVERENGLRSHLESLLELIDVPEANCSCHVAPPCGDCVEHGAMREAVVAARIALEELDAPGVPDDDELPGMWSHSDLMGGAADTQNDCAEKSPEALRTAALELADAMENKADMPLHKWAVKCLFLVNRVRRAAGVAPAQEAP